MGCWIDNKTIVREHEQNLDDLLQLQPGQGYLGEGAVRKGEKVIVADRCISKHAASKCLTKRGV
jgi:hypothetical protein